MTIRKKRLRLKNSKILLITHSYTTGPSQELVSFLKDKIYLLSFIDHPFSYAKKKRSSVTLYQKGEIIKKLVAPRIFGPDIFYYFKDFLFTILFVLKTGRKFDFCLAVDNLNTLSALILRKFGIVKKVIYYTIDYTPKRFLNPLFNLIYHKIDKFCCYHTDLIWSSSNRMKKARQKKGLDLKRCADEIIVSDGCHFKEIKRPIKKKINRFKLVFMGHLIANKGVDLILRSLPLIVKKYPKTILTIVGAGPEEKKLKSLAQRLNIRKNIIFTGFIKSHQELERIIANCGIAIAPYVPDPKSFTFFSDVGKVKVYLACGLPVLITDVPEIAKEIEREKAGAIFKYKKDSLVEKLKMLLENDKLYFQFRKNALAMAKNLDWEDIFNEALDKTLKLFYSNV